MLPTPTQESAMTSNDLYPKRDGRAFLDVARDRLGVQLDTLDAIDAKIALMFTTSTTLVGILAAILALRGGKFDTVSYILLGASMFSYLLVSVVAWRGYRAQTWNAGPNLVALWRFASESELSDQQLDWLVGNHLRRDYEKNGPAVEAKSKALDHILPALFIQTLTLVLTLVVVAA
jgi:hypothetical protein